MDNTCLLLDSRSVPASCQLQLCQVLLAARHSFHSHVTRTNTITSSPARFIVVQATWIALRSTFDRRRQFESAVTIDVKVWPNGVVPHFTPPGAHPTARTSPIDTCSSLAGARAVRAVRAVRDAWIQHPAACAVGEQRAER